MTPYKNKALFINQLTSRSIEYISINIYMKLMNWINMLNINLSFARDDNNALLRNIARVNSVENITNTK